MTRPLRQSKSQLPMSRAKTAYGLLSDISKLALDEPKRIDMNHWKLRIGAGHDGEVSRGFPACGTVACIGGWTEILHKGRAEDILGLSPSQRAELFYPSELLIHASVDGHRKAQTREHARKVVAHIRAFQKKYRAQLLAKKV